MKKFLSLLLLSAIAALSLFSAGTVLAEGDVYYYLKLDAEFTLTDAPGAGSKIRLGATWCVKKVADDTDPKYKIVEYSGVKGKIETAKLSVLTLTRPASDPDSKYYYIDTVNTGAKPTTVYANDFQDDRFQPTIAKDTPVQFVGTSTVNVNLILIRYSAGYGFVDKSDLTKTYASIPQNTSIVDPDKINGNGGGSLTPPGGNTQTPETPTNNLLRVLLITAICILAVLIVFLVFKPVKAKHKKNSDHFYEEE